MGSRCREAGSRSRVILLLIALTLSACTSQASPETTASVPASVPASEAAASVAPTADPAEGPEIVVEIGNTNPGTHPVNVTLTAIGESLAEQTDGRISFEIFPADQLGGSLDILDQVSNGTLDMTVFNPVITASLAPELGVFAAPFLFPDLESLYRAADSDVGQETFEALETSHGIKVLTSWFLGSWVFLTKDSPVHQCSDLEGRKLRTPPGPVLSRFVELCGASATQMTFSEVYLSLQTGVIDGIPIPLGIIESGKLYEVTDSVTTAPILYDVIQPMVNADWWSSLRPEDQELIFSALEEGREDNDALIHEAETTVVETMRDRGLGIDENPDLASFQDAADTLVQEFASEWGGEDHVEALLEAGQP